MIAGDVIHESDHRLEIKIVAQIPEGPVPSVIRLGSDT